ncbi:hypothetical protein FACS189425_07540 [Clostridia bacterium]|nr:hypothetical protein FACS189425_07540 [Clostridia bacterium]
MKQLLKDRRGSMQILAVVALMVTLILFTGIREAYRLSLVSEGLRDALQNAVVQVATSNYNGTYQGQRQGYSGGYDKADPAAAWTEALNRGDVRNALNTLLVAGNDYTIDSVDVTAANATFARTAGNISRVEIAATMTVQLYYHAGNLASVPITLNIRVRSGYTQKF